MLVRSSRLTSISCMITGSSDVIQKTSEGCVAVKLMKSLSHRMLLTIRYRIVKCFQPSGNKLFLRFEMSSANKIYTVCSPAKRLSKLEK
jgi:hypothetical protein